LKTEARREERRRKYVREGRKIKIKGV
jgi:hypothetical protein